MQIAALTHRENMHAPSPADAERQLSYSRPLLALLFVLLTFLIGYVDYATGPRISMSAFYFLPLALSAWFLDLPLSIAMLAICVCVGVAANILNGDPGFDTPALVGWNATAQLASNTVVLFALTKLRKLQSGLEQRVKDRAAALTGEIKKRERLQRELLDVSEMEQQRIGQDLHDGLCQHLAATALACQALKEDLADKNPSDAVQAQRVVELLEQGVELARQSAKGLDPVALDAEGLMSALEDLTETTRKLHRVDCVFECDSPVLLHDPAAAEQMYRIAQEAVRNAVQHASPRRIVVRLESEEDGLSLRVEDDGAGMRKAIRAGAGMGVRIMKRRARAVGAKFEARIGPNGGTIIVCTLPLLLESGVRT
jgi:signal transduction histidine kinase